MATAAQHTDLVLPAAIKPADGRFDRSSQLRCCWCVSRVAADAPHRWFPEPPAVRTDDQRVAQRSLSYMVVRIQAHQHHVVRWAQD